MPRRIQLVLKPPNLEPEAVSQGVQSELDVIVEPGNIYSVISDCGDGYCIVRCTSAGDESFEGVNLEKVLDDSDRIIFCEDNEQFTYATECVVSRLMSATRICSISCSVDKAELEEIVKCRGNYYVTSFDSDKVKVLLYLILLDTCVSQAWHQISRV